MNVENDRLILLEYLNMYFLKDDFMMSYNSEQYIECLNNACNFCSRCRYIINTDKTYFPICKKI